jgi:alpha-amylase
VVAGKRSRASSGLAETGCVEFLGETSHHSLAFWPTSASSTRRCCAQAARIERLFGKRPTTSATPSS